MMVLNGPKTFFVDFPRLDRFCIISVIVQEFNLFSYLLETLFHFISTLV
jgi:hypothetical protein